MDRRSFLGWMGAGAGACAGVCADPARAAGETGLAGPEGGFRPEAGSGPRYAMLIDLARCVGCQACTVSCAVENRAPLGRFRTTVGEYELRNGPAASSPRNSALALAPRLCNHCGDPACLAVCPVGATYRRADGIVVVDAARCLGCGFCVQACPYGARFLNHETRTADKCTFCAHRLAAGLLPACVESCVGGARLFGDLADPGSLVRRTLEQNKDRLAVLYPEKKTRPAVFYLGLDPFLVSSTNAATPLAVPGPRAGGPHA